jgi:chromosome segregation ATPase
LKLIKRLSDIENECKNITELKYKADIRYETNTSSLVQKHEGQVSELTSKIEIISEAHSRTSNDMHQLLGSQRRLSDKWYIYIYMRKDESVELRFRYEKIIEKTKQDVEHYKVRNIELEQQIGKGSLQRKEIIEQISIEKKEKALFHLKYNQAEQRVNKLTGQISSLVLKETKMVENIKHLRIIILISEREVDRANFQNKPKQTRCPAKDSVIIYPDIFDFENDNDIAQTKKLEADIERIKTRSNLNTATYKITKAEQQMNNIDSD